MDFVADFVLLELRCARCSAQREVVMRRGVLPLGTDCVGGGGREHVATAMRIRQFGLRRSDQYKELAAGERGGRRRAAGR